MNPPDAVTEYSPNNNKSNKKSFFFGTNKKKKRKPVCTCHLAYGLPATAAAGSGRFDLAAEIDQRYPAPDASSSNNIYQQINEPSTSSSSSSTPMMMMMQYGGTSSNNNDNMDQPNCYQNNGGQQNGVWNMEPSGANHHHQQQHHQRYQTQQLLIENQVPQQQQPELFATPSTFLTSQYVHQQQQQQQAEMHRHPKPESASGSNYFRHDGSGSIYNYHQQNQNLIGTYTPDLNLHRRMHGEYYQRQRRWSDGGNAGMNQTDDDDHRQDHVIRQEVGSYMVQPSSLAKSFAACQCGRCCNTGVRGFPHTDVQFTRQATSSSSSKKSSKPKVSFGPLMMYPMEPGDQYDSYGATHSATTTTATSKKTSKLTTELLPLDTQIPLQMMGDSALICRIL